MKIDVANAAVGAAFGNLFKVVNDAIQSCVSFSSDLKRLKSTLTFIKPVIHEISALDKILDTPHQETEAFEAQLLKVEKLVRKCMRVRRWNVAKRMYYSGKMRKLEESLLGFFQVNVVALQFREIKRMAVANKCMEEQMRRLEEKVINERTQDYKSSRW